MLSKSNSSFIKKTVLVKLIIYSLLTQFKLQSRSFLRFPVFYYSLFTIYFSLISPTHLLSLQ
ncbi:hypothetical protein D0T60_13090 [Bacteroides sp. 224]|nr:hypothetical protein [Bacteroides sp. 224]